MDATAPVTVTLADAGAAPNAAAATSITAMESTIAPAAHALSLADLPRNAVATVSALRATSSDTDPALIQRLIEIGFVPGEKLRIIAFGHPGREPIAVRIGSATFALRRFEAQCVLVATEHS